MNLDIILINPPYDLSNRMGRLARIAPTVFPVGLAFLAANLRKNGFKVSIIDPQVHDFSFDILKERLETDKPLAVGLTTTTPTIDTALAIAKMTKDIAPQTKVILGGCHATFLAEQLIKTPSVDVIVRGEGEKIIVNLMRAFKTKNDLDSVQGITYKQGNKIGNTVPEAMIENLDELPLPARELLPIEKYRADPDLMNRLPVRYLITSRGCPYNCVYCGARYISGRKFRYNSPTRVLEEMNILINKYRARQVVFMDDSFTINNDRVAQICRLMIKQGLPKKISWFCGTRVDSVTLPLLQLMRTAGCRTITYGIETAVPRLLKKIKKGITIEQIQQAVKWTKQAGIECRATFMLGIPTETRAESLQTIAFAKKLDVDWAKFSLATPYPGTEFYNMARMAIANKDWQEYNVMSGYTDKNVLYLSQGRTSAELKSLQQLAMREFYLRPKIILGLIARTRNFEQLKSYAASALALLVK